MRRIRWTSALAAATLLAGCGGNDEIQIINPQRLELDAEQSQSIKSADRQVDAEEGGSQKIIKPTKGKKR